MPAPRGRIQRGHEAQFDPASRGPYRPGPSFRGDVAVKLVTMSRASGVSVSEVLTRLVELTEVDEHGRPVVFAADDEELPLQNVS